MKRVSFVLLLGLLIPAFIGRASDAKEVPGAADWALRVQIEGMATRDRDIVGFTVVQLLNADLDAFAIVSEPSNTLLCFVVSSDRDPGDIEAGKWYQEIVAPLRAERGWDIGLQSRLTSGVSLLLQHPRRPPADIRLIFHALGSSLREFKGQDVLRFSLGQAQRPNRSLYQGFAIPRSRSRMNTGVPCSCGMHPPPPCGITAGDDCSQCGSCPDDKPGQACQCCGESSTQCGMCGRIYAQCNPNCPSC